MTTRLRSARFALWALVLLVAVPLGSLAAESPVDESKQDKDRRMGWWRDARFGMFIHWGLYAIPAGEWKGKKIDGIGEWIQDRAKVPPAEYEPLQKQFNPVKFDANQWVRIAKSAGMKYIVITSKHHDGFCLWDSKLTDWDVMGSPFQRDILKELSEACKREGITLCFYHSIMDWHHPNYLPRRSYDPRSADGADFDRYIRYLKGQLKELTTGYGKIGILWFDGEWEKTWTHEHGVDLYSYCRSLDKDVIVNNRVDKGRQGMQGMSKDDSFKGDYGTPEQEIPPTGLPGLDWETCMTMNDTWGFKKDDQNWKPSQTLIRNLIDIASKGGNFLLNVGPTAEGLIPEPSVQRLAAMGKWMDVNGESIYGTTASPFKKLAWGRATKKPGKIYLHVFNWPKGKLDVPGLKNKINKAYLLADSSKASLQCTPTESGLSIELPAKAPDAVASVIVLEIVGEPEVVSLGLTQSSDGKLALPAAEAAVHGHTAKYESGDGKDSIGYWTNAKDYVEWGAAVKTPGEFKVEIAYACQDDSAGSSFAVNVAGQELTGKVEGTGAWNRYSTKSLGTVKIAAAGPVKVTVKPKDKPKYAVMNLKSIALVPVK